MDTNCTLFLTMEYLSKKWAILILHELYKGEPEWKRFTDLKKSLKEITPKILSERLKELEGEGLVEKRVDSSVTPIRSEYRLTPAGEELMPVIQGLKRWALKWKINNPACSTQNCHLCKL